jgi:hypothetical protein
MNYECEWSSNLEKTVEGPNKLPQNLEVWVAGIELDAIQLVLVVT